MTSPEPKVSAILPTFNRAGTIKRAIRSTLAQIRESSTIINSKLRSYVSGKELSLSTHLLAPYRMAKDCWSVIRDPLGNVWKLAAHLRARRHWTAVSRRKQPSRLRWWESAIIVQHVNKKICGEPTTEVGAASPILIKKRYPGRVFSRAVSIGCGNGLKEMQLVQAGLVEEVHLFELSKLRVEQGMEIAKRHGLTGRVHFFNRDGLNDYRPDFYDLVYWNNSLHHMMNTERAIRWSYNVLRIGGLFYMDDFVGPNRMQWSSRTLDMASRVRSALPERFLRNPRRPNQLIPRRARKPNRLRMLIADPTECADSARILPALKTVFSNIRILPTGGVIYHLALNDILHNLDEENNRDLLDQLLRIDDICIRLGEYHYAVAYAEKLPSGSRKK